MDRRGLRSLVRGYLALWLVFLMAWLPGQALAGLIPDGDRDELIAQILKNFWGRAKLSNGEFAQPASEAERNTSPVSRAIAYRSIDAGEVSGLGEWCKLDWQPHYFSLTKAARAKSFVDKQVAFVSFLHGAAQGRIATAMAKSGRPCTDDERAKVGRMIDQSRQRGFEDK